MVGISARKTPTPPADAEPLGRGPRLSGRQLRGASSMVDGVVLMNVERPHVPSVAEKVVDLPGVTSVFSVAGRYDLVVLLRVKSNEDLAELVTKRLAAVDGIERTETLIAFEVYSRFDAERPFT
jgi:DNA-binding Lrp family transcriptional regulator